LLRSASISAAHTAFQQLLYQASKAGQLIKQPLPVALFVKIDFIMPESNKMAIKRKQKANREAGIGDELGRLVRVKDAKPTGFCSQCKKEMTFTKTNKDAINHATMHGISLEEAFQGAEAAQQALIEAAAAGKKGVTPEKKGGGSSSSKKGKGEVDLDDLFAAGLAAGPKKGKK
jgi:hypothetical protein